MATGARSPGLLEVWLGGVVIVAPNDYDGIIRPCKKDVFRLLISSAVAITQTTNGRYERATRKLFPAEFG